MLRIGWSKKDIFLSRYLLYAPAVTRHTFFLTEHAPYRNVSNVESLPLIFEAVGVGIWPVAIWLIYGEKRVASQQLRPVRHGWCSAVTTERVASHFETCNRRIQKSQQPLERKSNPRQLVVTGPMEMHEKRYCNAENWAFTGNQKSWAAAREQQEGPPMGQLPAWRERRSTEDPDWTSLWLKPAFAEECIPQSDTQDCWNDGTTITSRKHLPPIWDKSYRIRWTTCCQISKDTSKIHRIKWIPGNPRTRGKSGEPGQAE